MPRRYPVEFRRKVLDLIEAGRPVVEIAAQLGVSDQTIYKTDGSRTASIMVWPQASRRPSLRRLASASASLRQSWR